MKYILSLVLIILSVQSFGQYTVNQQIGSPNTLVQVPANGGFRAGLITISVADTTAANLTNLKFYDGAIIKTQTPVALWYRYLAGQQWVQILPAAGSSGGLQSWLVGGNTTFLGGALANEVLGTTTGIAKGVALTTNGVARLTITSAGAWGLGAGLDYGTSGYVLTSNGTGTAPTWQAGGGGGSGWGLTGNAGTTAGTDFIGTKDAQDLVAKTNSVEQLRFLSTGGIMIPTTVDSTIGVIFKGSDRFIHNFILPGATGTPSTPTKLMRNLFIGRKSGNFSLTGSATYFGTGNLGIGDSTLFAITTGYRNIAIGVFAGASNTTGFENTILGASAHEKGTTARQNTAIGALSLANITTGFRNTTVGFSTLQFATTAERNVAVGGRAMNFGSTAQANTGVGFDALAYNSTASHNTAVGLDALYYSDGSHNTAVGDSTLWGLYGISVPHVGYKNVALGSRAGYHLGDTYPNFASIYDTACIFLGGNASRDSSISYTTSLQNMTVIGYNARGSASNQVVLGNDDVTSTLLKGSLNARGYGTGAYTGTATYALQVDASGNVIEGALGGGGGSQDLQDVTDIGYTTTNPIKHEPSGGAGNYIQLTNDALNPTLEAYNPTTTESSIVQPDRFAIGNTSWVKNIVPGTLSANRTLTLPDASGTFALTSDIPAAGANTALSNLASVAINTDLLPGATSSVNLGSGSLGYLGLYLQGVFSGANAGIEFSTGGIGNNSRYLIYNRAGGNDLAIYSYNSTTHLFSLNENGAFGIGGNAYLQTSATIQGTSGGLVGIGLSAAPTLRLQVAGRFASTQGADVASVAGAIALGTDGNSFEITGTNAITLISSTSWVNGSEVTLLFTSTVTLTDGVANSGTDIGMELAGNTNFVASAGATITLILSEIGGTQRFREKSRSVN